jgi:hypothetical protein
MNTIMKMNKNNKHKESCIETEIKKKMINMNKNNIKQII